RRHPARATQPRRHPRAPAPRLRPPAPGRAGRRHRGQPGHAGADRGQARGRAGIRRAQRRQPDVLRGRGATGGRSAAGGRPGRALRGHGVAFREPPRPRRRGEGHLGPLNPAADGSPAASIGYDRAMGDPRHRDAWCGWLLCLLLLCPSLAGAAGLSVRELRDDPPAAEVLAGMHDDRLLPAQARPYIQQRTRSAQWWRIESASPIDGVDAPQLLMRSPFLYRVEAWVPGATAPTRHAMYGEHADDRYSHRALVIALPAGIPAGEPVWLRVERASSMLPRS